MSADRRYPIPDEHLRRHILQSLETVARDHDRTTFCRHFRRFYRNSSAMRRFPTIFGSNTFLLHCRRFQDICRIDVRRFLFRHKRRRQRRAILNFKFIKQLFNNDCNKKARQFDLMENFSLQVSISPTFYVQIFYKRAFRSFSLLTVWLFNFFAKIFWHKSSFQNNGEIDYSSQFHQHFMSSFCANIL